MRYLVVILLLFLLGTNQAFSQISRFDNDSEQWYANDDAVGNVVIYDVTTGNPPPSVYANDSDTGAPWYFVAPPCFLGDRSYAYEDTIKYDILIGDYGNTPYTNDISFIGANGMRLVHNHANDPIVNVWTSYAVPLEPAFWFIGNGNGPNPTEPQMLAVLSDIASLEIRGEYKTGFDRAWLDNVWIGDVPEEYINGTICQGEVYQVGNYSHTQPGLYLDELEAQNGCDSVLINLYLTVLPTSSSVDFDDFCTGETYTLPDGTTTTTPGFFEYTYEAANGCDSVHTLQLQQQTSIEYNFQDVFCEGTMFILPDGSQTDQAGLYEFSYPTQFCDSIVKLQLNMASVKHTDIKKDLCKGESYMLPNGLETFSPGDYSFDFFTIFGCDSTVNVSLAERDTSWMLQRDTICNGSFFQMPDGSVASSAGAYANRLSTGYGCDSTILVDLLVLDSSLVQERFVRCGLDLVTLPDGSIADVDGIYTFQYPLPWGCDSTVIYDVKYHPTYDTLVEVMLSEGTQFMLPDGQTIIDTSFNAFYNFKTPYGCDSSVALRIDYVYHNLYAPNVFSPDLDGVNDFFTLYSDADMTQIIELRIYDRWGALVFEKNNFEGGQDALGWNGMHKGKEVNPGVFVWTAQVEYRDGVKFVVQGDVTVIR